MQGYSIQIRFLLRTFHYFSVNTIHNLLFFFRSISGRVPGAVTVPVRTVILQSWSLHKGAGLTTIHQNLTIPGACLYAQMGCNIHQLAAQTVASNTHLGKHDFFPAIFNEGTYLTKSIFHKDLLDGIFAILLFENFEKLEYYTNHTFTFQTLR